VMEESWFITETGRIDPHSVRSSFAEAAAGSLGGWQVGLSVNLNL